MMTCSALHATLLSACVALASRGLEAQQPSRDSAFLLSTGDPARSPSPFIGNGRMGLVVPANGTGPGESYLAGLYDEAPGDVPRIALLPAWSTVDVFAGGGSLNAAPAPPLQGYRQTLDMRTATMRTSYDWAEGASRMAVRVESFVSRADPQLAAVRVDLVPRTAGRVRVRFPLATRPGPRRLALATIERSDPAWRPADTWYPGHMLGRGGEAALDSAGAVVSLVSTPEGRSTTLAQAAAVAWPTDLGGPSAQRMASNDSAAAEVAFDAVPGRTYTFVKFVSIDTGGSAARERAVRAARAARARGYDALHLDHAGAWQRRWETDIEIDGDPALQRAVRAMLFQLLCSADSGTAMGIPPMGLSGGGYYGHVFWDSDTWMFPALLVTHPDVARSLVAFRGRTLDAARRNAGTNGYEGAMYPWEADERGRETTPRFAIQNARSEIHINGDVALAQWQYYLATGDSLWLARDGYPVIGATADFWVSRASYDSTERDYDVHDVVSVAEGLVGVSNDSYTNAVARRNLTIAAEASRRLGRPAKPAWARVAELLYMPFDSASGTYRTYEGAPDSTLGWVTPLLSYPLGLPMTETVKRTTLRYGARRLIEGERGAMMGGTLLGVVAAELGERALVDTLLPLSYRDWLKGPFLMLSETPTNDAVSFVTGAGGFLQQVIFGFTGLRLGDAGLEPDFDPVLPSRITRLALRNLRVRGRRYDVVVDASGRRVVPRSAATGRR